jgi:hypothetical protein
MYRNAARTVNTVNTVLLTSQQSEQLLSGFPMTRLSYEAVIHKNDNSVLQQTGDCRCFIIPKGRRCIAWITEWKRVKIVAIIEVMSAAQRHGHGHSHGQGPVFTPFLRTFQQENGWIPGTIRLYDACMDNTMAYGSVFGGTVFRMSANTYFSIHHIYWYKGDSVPPLKLSEHIRLCEDIFSRNNIRQIAYTKQNSILFGLPVLCYSNVNIQSVIDDLPYQVFAIQYRYDSTTRVCHQLVDNGVAAQTVVALPPVTLPPVALPPVALPPVALPPVTTRRTFIQPRDDMMTNIQAIFVVRSSSSLVFHNFAHIPNYKTSVMMNGYFRTIAENKRLDALEESEDESTFENTDPDKYVSLDKEFLMMCRFNKRFCRWVPFQMLSSTKTKTIPLDSIITQQQVRQHESKYINRHKRI